MFGSHLLYNNYSYFVEIFYIIMYLYFVLIPIILMVKWFPIYLRLISFYSSLITKVFMDTRWLAVYLLCNLWQPKAILPGFGCIFEFLPATHQVIDECFELLRLWVFLVNECLAHLDDSSHPWLVVVYLYLQRLEQQNNNVATGHI